MLDAAEGEVDIVLAGSPNRAAVYTRLVGKKAGGTVGRGQGDGKVANPRVIDVDRHLDMIDLQARGKRDAVVHRRGIGNRCPWRRGA